MDGFMACPGKPHPVPGQTPESYIHIGGLITDFMPAKNEP
jgi:hypothetical protein